MCTKGLFDRFDAESNAVIRTCYGDVVAEGHEEGRLISSIAEWSADWLDWQCDPRHAICPGCQVSLVWVDNVGGRAARIHGGCGDGG